MSTAGDDSGPGHRDFTFLSEGSTLGNLVYNSAVKVELEDRALSHLLVVISNKLRRGEAFNFTWRDDASLGHGRTTVWMHSQASLVYKFYGGREPSLNRTWLEALSQAANSTTGLYLVPEPAEESAAVAGTVLRG